MSNNGERCEELYSKRRLNEIEDNSVREYIGSKKPCVEFISKNDSETDGKSIKVENEHDDSNPSQQLEDVPPNNNKNEVKYFNGVEISKLTKRQMKKYQKYVKWQEIKKEKRAKEKLKNKKKRIHARLNNIDLGPSRKALKCSTMANSPCKITVCIDLSFDHLMIDKDMAKTAKQLLRVYTENRRAKAPMQLHLCDFNGRSKEEMARHHGYEHWDINFHSESYMDVFSKDKLVYLTSESDNVITELDQEKVYIIGGLVDHNFHKGLCYEKAVQQGIAHAQLPINEFFQMNHRKVLTINQVFEILLRVSEGKSFKEALEMIIPKRVNMQPAVKDDAEPTGNTINENDEDS